MHLKISFYLLFHYFLSIGVRSLDLNEDSDEIEIYKNLFAKLNKILEENYSLQNDLAIIKTRIQSLEEKLNQNPDTLKETDLKKADLVNCNSRLTSISSAESSDNYCFGNNWIVIQRRTDGSENFYRSWNDYKIGFGNKSNEFFIGLENLYQITTEKPHELLITMVDYDNAKRYAKYDQFEIGSEQQQYVLKTLGNYSGNAGDSLTYHKGSEFSTYDRDNDDHMNFNCARGLQSAWWFKACSESNLNGCYSDANLRDSRIAVACGINWRTFRGQWYSLKFVEVLIRSKL